jgi:putative ATP-dependent endonuclease of the OLD family
MSVLGLDSIKISNYKCFGDEPQGFDDLRPINVIIGRNNAGKSSLLDVLKFAIGAFPTLGVALHHKGKETRLHVPLKLTELQLRPVYPRGHSGGLVHMDFWEYGSRFLGAPIALEIFAGGKRQISKFPAGLIDPEGQPQAKFIERLAQQLPNPLIPGKHFRHLFAERNLRPEQESESITIQGDGTGVTNAMHQFLNFAKYPRAVIDKIILGELNSVMKPDLEFSAIQARKIDSNHWEIFLEEGEKGLIAVQQTGSGFKTILLALAFLHLIPRVEGHPAANYVFAFEELENHLHPAVQRRLLSYLRKYALDNGAKILLTTHSSVVIDMFSRDMEAQILHVSHDRERAKVTLVSSYLEHRGILDDLDVRASDLLQANGVIWVEGPSDRIYVNRWIELWSGGSLREDTHYQVVFYGGRLLAHLSAEVPEESSQAVKILRVNRNAAVLIDSDKRTALAKINKTKQRVLSEVQAIGGLGWVTAGREVEHYVPPAAIQVLYSLPAAPILDPLAEFGSILSGLAQGESERFKVNKPLFAEKVVPLLTRDDLAGHLDLSMRLEDLCGRIKAWNGL